MHRNNDFTDELAKLRKEVDQLKSTQFMGRDIYTYNVIPYSSNSSDWSLAGNTQTVLYMELVADTQLNPMGKPVFDVSRTDTSTPATVGTFYFTLQDVGAFNPGDGRIRYMMNVYNNATGTLYLKAYMCATDTGTLYFGDDDSTWP